MKNHTVIIGAGVTGLRTAVYLLDAGHNVTIIEKTQKVGGMCATFKYNDFLLDYGPHKFYTQIPGVYEDFKALMGEEYLEIKKKNSIRLLGRYFSFPVKLSELALNIPLSKTFMIGMGLIKSKLSSRRVVSYEDYFLKGFGKTGYELVFKGFAEKVWGNPANLSEELARRRSPASSIFDVIKTALKTSANTSADFFLYPKKGYGDLSERMAELIKSKGGKIILNSSPINVKLKGNKVSEIKINVKNKVKSLKCDNLVSTLAITELPKIFKIEDKVVKESIDKLKFRSILITYIFLNKDRALKDNWIFFPEREFIFNRVAEQKSFSPFTGKAGKTVITAEVTCNFGDEVYNMDELELKKKVIKDLVKANLIKEKEVYDFIVRKAGRVYPIYSLDYKQNLNVALDYFDKIDNFFTSGRLGLFNYNNADHCLDMAKVTSNLIISNRPRTDWKKAREYFDSYRIVD